MSHAYSIVTVAANYSLDEALGIKKKKKLLTAEMSLFILRTAVFIQTTSVPRIEVHCVPLSARI